VANIRRMLGEPGQAEAAYRRAIELLESLARDEPGNLDHQANLGLTLDDLGESLRMSGDPAGAERHEFRASQIADRRLERAPHQPDYLRLKAWNLKDLAEAYADIGRLDDARDAATRAVGLLEALASRDRATVMDGLTLAMAHQTLGRAHREAG